MNCPHRSSTPGGYTRGARPLVRRRYSAIQRPVIPGPSATTPLQIRDRFTVPTVLRIRDRITPPPLCKSAPDPPPHGLCRERTPKDRPSPDLCDHPPGGTALHHSL